MGINQNKPIGEMDMKIFSAGPWMPSSLPVCCLFSFSENKPETKKELYDFLAITYYRMYFSEDAKKQSEDELKNSDKIRKHMESNKSMFSSASHISNVFSLIPSDYISKEVRRYSVKSLPEVQLVVSYLAQLQQLVSLSCEELIDRIESLHYTMAIEVPFSTWQETFPSINFKKLFREGEFIEIYLDDYLALKNSSGENLLFDEAKRRAFLMQEEEILSLFIKNQQEWMKEHSKRPSNFMGKKKQDYEDIRNYKGRYWGLDR